MYRKKRRYSLILFFVISIVLHSALFLLPLRVERAKFSKPIEVEVLSNKETEKKRIEFVHQDKNAEENPDAKRLSYETRRVKKETRTHNLIAKSNIVRFAGQKKEEKIIEPQKEGDVAIARNELSKDGDDILKKTEEPGVFDRELKEEETVNLNTQEFRFISYFSKIKSKIELVWTYPYESIVKGEEGSVELSFTILEDGSLDAVKIIRSSGFTDLDSEAQRAIRVASPFPPLPRSWGIKRLNVIGNFNYILGYKIIR